MAYKYTRGSVNRGDIYNEDDTQGNTYIDWSEDAFGVVAAGSLAFSISGSNEEISSSYNLSASAFYGDGSGLSNVSATSSPAGSNGEVQFNNNGSLAGADNLYFDNANKRVGIGAPSPAYRLDVAGNIGLQEYIYHSGDDNTYIRFQTDDIVLQAGGKGMIKMDEGNLRITVNTGSNDIDFIIKDGSGQELLTTKGSKGHLGIHNDTPGHEFVVGQDTLIVSGSTVGIGSAWSGKELHVTDGDSNTSAAPTDSQVVVESGGNAGISLLAGGTRARIYFGDDSDIDEGIIEYKFTNSERFNITVNANEVMRIYESGASNTITTLNGVKTTAGLFTEGHPYYSNDANITVGDCCVLENGQIVRSSSPMQKNVGGIAWYSVLDDLQNPGPSGDEAWPLTLDDNTVSRVAEDALGVQCNMAEESGGEWAPTAKFQTLWKLAAIGDSRQSNYGTTALTGFKVCNEGGEISAGDLLCTSTTPGYLMKQPDDIMRNYTVGKAMEDVTFDSAGLATGIYGYVYCG
jgi:hypothetical protein